jgi:hypothetical protein
MTVLAHYELMDEVGVGGMGTVHRARDSRDGSIVAVKVLHPHLSRDPDYIRRFEREVRIAQRLDSPRIVRVLDAGADGASRYIVMEYVEGKTLAQVIHERGQLPVAEVIAIATAVAEALDAAHAAGIVHRDISPQNVLIQPDGSVKVTDFGVARDLGATAMTATSMLLGKPQYIAPEVVTGKSPVDIRSDVYSLGVVLYQMLTGVVPFNAETPFAVMQAQVYQPVPQLGRQRRDVPESLLITVDKCLAKDPRERFQTPTALLEALRSDASRAPAMVSPRHRAAIPAVVGLFGFVTFGTVLAMSALNDGTTTPDVAVVREQTGAVDLVLAIDLSGSQVAFIEQSKQAAINLVNSLQAADRVEVIGFSNQTEVLLPLTADTTAIGDVLNGLQAIPNSNTAMNSAILTAVQAAGAATAPGRVVVVISDGEEFGGRSIAVEGQIAEAALARGVQIYSVYVGDQMPSVLFNELPNNTGGLRLTWDQTASIGAHVTETLRSDVDPAPAAPSNLTSEADNDLIRLGWHDNSNNETGFEVSDGTTVIRLAANTDEYNYAAPPNTHKCFAVRAFNSYGASAWIAQACATTGGGSTTPPGGSCTNPPSLPTNFTLNTATRQLSWQVLNPGGTGCVLTYRVENFDHQEIYRGSSPSVILPTINCNSGYFVGAENQNFGLNSPLPTRSPLPSLTTATPPPRASYAFWPCPNP